MARFNRLSWSALVVVLALGATPLQAQDKGPDGRLSPEQRQKLFPEQKALWLRHQRDRLSAMQTAERCVTAARSGEAFKACLRQERQRAIDLRRSHITDMRALYSRYGLELPERDRQGKPGWGDRSQPQI